MEVAGWGWRCLGGAGHSSAVYVSHAQVLRAEGVNAVKSVPYIHHGIKVQIEKVKQDILTMGI